MKKKIIPVLFFLLVTALAVNAQTNRDQVNNILFNVFLKVDRTVLLKWKSMDDSKSVRYEIERSTDEVNWTKLPAMIRQEQGECEFTDNSVNAGIYYYRLKQLLADDKYAYSIVKGMRIIGVNKFFIWPNPCREYLFIETNLMSGTIEIVGMNAGILLKQNITNAKTIIPVKTLAKGVYVIRIIYNGELYTEKFIKE